MSQLSEILSIQKSLEEHFTKKMDQLGAQIQAAGPVKDTVAKVAEEFRAFRELIYSVLGLLRKQIAECVSHIDTLEMRHRRKALIFQGLPEAEKEDCSSKIIHLLSSKLALRNITAANIKVAHRLGSPGKDHPRPILVRFSNLEVKSLIWKAKTGLKGSKISVKEFLTKTRQSVFTQARQHFGMRSCWTQDGVIVVKASDGTRHKITSMDELKPLLDKYPTKSSPSSTA
ncbi:uncharacterized protein LOC124636317 [Helicoverpa zea]|uniref:uncharacterized protein LOC124635732 n=1 Tax=Helicoverpa zea TaxID=7113 RepID=UPI001F577446|nr:uncharacterized protein LOC124635732 [Helicoverpa zea]XP_047028313.1 uncharacterized protein LOC124636317 [Helicoverpa zea]